MGISSRRRPPGTPSDLFGLGLLLFESAMEVRQALFAIAPVPAQGYAQSKQPVRAVSPVWEAPQAIQMSSGRRLAASAAIVVVVGGLALAAVLTPGPTDVGFWVRLAVGVVCVHGSAMGCGWPVM